MFWVSAIWVLGIAWLSVLRRSLGGRRSWWGLKRLVWGFFGFFLSRRG